jgi:hypothetical protein
MKKEIAFQLTMKKIHCSCKEGKIISAFKAFSKAKIPKQKKEKLVVVSTTRDHL